MGKKHDSNTFHSRFRGRFFKPQLSVNCEIKTMKDRSLLVGRELRI